MLLRNIIHNGLPEAAAQVQILQPDQIALIFRALNDPLDICNPGKHRRDKTDRTDSGVINLFHGRKPAHR